MSQQELDAAAKAHFALLKAKYPQHFGNTDSLFFEVAFAAGANWAAQAVIDKFKEAA